MPELPEVESVRRHLEPVLIGRKVVAVEVNHPRTARRNAHPSDVVNRLTGATVERLQRHGKFLMADLDNGMVWVTHLGMSGRMLVAAPDEARPPHTHFVARTDHSDEIRFIDPRTFGFVAVVTPEELAQVTKLGPDALNTLPRSPGLGRMLAGRKAPIKALLLDQRVLAGLGNIYADEVLHRAGVRPTRPGGEVSAGEVKKMRAAIRPVLDAGIAAGGTSLKDLSYLLPDGQAGQYLARLRVYGREGEPCRKCGTRIERIVVGGRSSFFCPSCQS
ncbi:MAG TPA: bifunctional DNA-formamidopyrimidine glycosylase/DNA-(apurinic or apyrimidinic site) lyase [Acidimicrobiia bacterium]|nr:bifunctional DNA-formamidopyrimidine glycosylase/DNA-(apurinic or apyrimidinic site) lyase [Acidimicrobiia bacterium]